MRKQYQRDSKLSFLRNPIALLGVGSFAAILSVVLLVVFVGQQTDAGTGTNVSSSGGKAKATQQAREDLTGLIGKAKSTINVRSGPANGYEALGLLLKGAQISIVGQSDDGEWLQIEYPVHSNLHGWVLADSLDVEGSLADVPIATPEVLPLAEVPTYEAVPTDEGEVPTGETGTPTPGALPDLVISGSLVSAGTLVVTITNQGSGVLSMTAIDISVLDTSGNFLNGTSSAPTALNPGASIDIRTGFQTLGAGQVVVIVDPSGKIEESDSNNNSATLTLGPYPSATPTTEPKATKTQTPAAAPTTTPTPIVF
jgi:hypothetical protein